MDLPIEIIQYVETQYHDASIKRIGNGLTESTFLISLPREKYVLKLLDTNILLSRLLRELWIAQYASEQKIAPHIKEINFPLKFIITDYIENNNSQSSIDNALSHLKKIHESIPYEPFTTIYQRALKIDGNELLTMAIQKLKEIEIKMKKEDFKIGICHLDLHMDNILFTENEIKIIDWSSSSIGHPYYDIAKLTFFKDDASAYQCLKNYLEREATPIEKEHFFLMRLIVNLAIATNKFLKNDLLIAEKYLKIFLERGGLTGLTPLFENCP